MTYPDQFNEGRSDGEGLTRYVGPNIEQKVAELLGATAYQDEWQVDDSARREAMERARQWWERGAPGQPLLEVGQDFATDNETVGKAGILRESLCLDQGRSGLWQVTTWIQTRDNEGVSQPGHFTYAFSRLLNDVRRHRPTSLVVGEANVRGWIGEHGINSLLEDSPTLLALRRDIRMLGRLYEGLIPPGYLGLTDDQHAHVIERLRSEFWKGEYDAERQEALKAICYITGQELATALDGVQDELAGMLPLDPVYVDMSALQKASRLARPLSATSPILQGLEGVNLYTGHEIKLAAYLSGLYQRRARQLETVGILPGPQPPPAYAPIDDHELGPTPEFRQMHIFRIPFANPTQIRDDLSYLLELRQARRSVEVLERDDTVMYRATPQLVNFVLASPDPSERALTLRAMEYLFDIQRPEQHEWFYHLLCERLAAGIPDRVEAWGVEQQRGYLRIAATIGELMPNPPVDSRGRPLPQPARTSAVMSSIYRLQALQLLAGERRRDRRHSSF